MKKDKKVRITLDLGPISQARLRKLERALPETSKIGIMRQALELLERVVETLEQGREVLVVDENGQRKPVLILGLDSAKGRGLLPASPAPRRERAPASGVAG